MLNKIAVRENAQFQLQQSRALRTYAFQEFDLGMEEIRRQRCGKMVGFGAEKVFEKQVKLRNSKGSFKFRSCWHFYQKTALSL